MWFTLHWLLQITYFEGNIHTHIKQRKMFINDSQSLPDKKTGHATDYIDDK